MEIRSRLKKGLPSRYQERRRSDALERQRAARADIANKARLFTATGETLPEDTPLDDGVLEERLQAKSKENRSYWGKQLQIFEWLVDIPQNLATEWYVFPRPEGQRCLVTTSHSSTIARCRNGVVIERFSSSLPGGGPQTKSSTMSMLDCIEQGGVYYILDVLCWKGYQLCNCTAEFRQYWIRHKMIEEKLEFDDSRFCLLPCYDGDSEGLTAAARGPSPFLAKDGIVLLHREALYEPGEVTPLALLWKDALCSRYFIETDSQGCQLAEQHVVLAYEEGGTVATGDRVPVHLGRMPPTFSTVHVQPGTLLRFSIGPGGFLFCPDDGTPYGADLKYVGAAHQRRRRGADTLSKILFQHLARRRPIALEQLIGDEMECIS